MDFRTKGNMRVMMHNNIQSILETTPTKMDSLKRIQLPNACYRYKRMKGIYQLNNRISIRH